MYDIPDSNVAIKPHGDKRPWNAFQPIVTHTIYNLLRTVTKALLQTLVHTAQPSQNPTSCYTHTWPTREENKR